MYHTVTTSLDVLTNLGSKGSRCWRGFVRNKGKFEDELIKLVEEPGNSQFLLTIPEINSILTVIMKWKQTH